MLSLTTASQLCMLCGQSSRSYALCCKNRPKPGSCACPHVCRRIEPPSECIPGPIPPNPCCPMFHYDHDSYKKYKYGALFIMFPLIIIQYIRTCGHEIPEKEDCRAYEYMRTRTKRFPWGDGNKSFFHNDHLNSLPDECTPAPLDCD